MNFQPYPVRPQTFKKRLQAGTVSIYHRRGFFTIVQKRKMPGYMCRGRERTVKRIADYKAQTFSQSENRLS